MKVSVSILNEKDDYISAVNKLNNTSADYLHLDIMDGSFTENTSFSFAQSKEIVDISNKLLDVHIMSSKLDIILDYYISLNPEIITIHSEVDNIDKYINKIRENNIKVGLALNPETDIEKITTYLNKIDIVLIMGVTPGKGGQSLKKESVSKLKELKRMQKKYKFIIEVDGGINNETIKCVKDYVDLVVSGSYITNFEDYQIGLNNLI
ncbi:MAG: ribulose-phosphate 3-epimerase [Bacilli bacterium]|nr:ribulose-phosphate 3-epimerase [Bacilli bacterium]MBP3635317.1 ribulose-phosphate 3-epimerase [Bacilli bacterium]